MKKSAFIGLLSIVLLLSSFLLVESPGLRSTPDEIMSVSTSISSPSTGSWQRTDFTVQFTDFATDYSNLLAEWRVISSGTVTLDWSARSVSGNSTVTVGNSAYARHQGVNVVTVYSRLTDLNSGSVANYSRVFSIDWSSDAILILVAKTSSVGTTISPGSWTKDRDPYFSYSINTGSKYSPIVGYSWAVNSDPDDITELSGGDSGALQLALNYLTEGSQSFGIRAKDAAGNTGLVKTISFGVDYTTDIIESLTAYTEQDGQEIPEDTWQTDSDVWFEWPVPGSTSPIEGFSWTLNSTPDAAVDLVTTGVTVTIPDGENVFNVRAIDAAGNVGPVISFNIRQTDVTYTLNYLSGGNGIITGNTTQVVRFGDDGYPVEAVPDDGYKFIEWSDGKTDNPRTDLNISEDISVSASFDLLTGIDGIVDFDILCYPNPCTTHITLIIENGDSGIDLFYQLIDINGRLIDQDRIVTRESIISMEKFDKSIYILRLLKSDIQIKSFLIEKH